MPSEKLMPCPFCGGSIELRQMGDDKFVAILCENCQASGPNHYGKHEWNSRFTAAEQAEPAPTYDAPLGAIENGRVFLQRLVDRYDFQCEAGGLANCSDYHEVVRCFEAMAEWIYHHAPAARSGAMKVLDEDDYEEIVNAAAIKMRKATSGVRGQVITVQDSLDWWVMKETEHRILAALEPAEPATDAEPVDWQYRFETETERWTNWRKGKAPKWVKKTTNFEERPLFTHPPESRLREALEWYAEQARLCRLIHSGGDAGRNALAKDGGAKARAALAQEDGRNE